jgi:energy-coupling factor transporter transmembrane protein EcfT
MAFIGILFLNILLIFILGSTLIAFVFFIISMILFLKAKKQKKYIKKTSSIVTLVISIILFLPLLITIFILSINSKIQDEKEKTIIESIENKVVVTKDKWKEGFEYNGENLVPVNIFMNSDNYNSSGVFKNLNNIGALVIENTNYYYNLYEIDNDSGYKIYYVWVESFVNGKYYSRTFVNENEYDSILQYYNTSDLKISALWKSEPQDTELRYVQKSLNLDINNYRDKLIQLSHEVLDDISNKKLGGIPLQNYDKYMEFEIKSTDKVFTISLRIYTKDDEMKLYLNKYEVEDKIVQKYKDMLFSLIDDAQKELLQGMKEIQ